MKILYFYLISLFLACREPKKSPPMERLDIHLCTMMGDMFAPPNKLVGDSILRWDKKRVEVYFIDDDGHVLDKVLLLANTWRPYSGVQFVRSFNQNDSDIRISFRTNGWWSYIGSNASQISRDSVTLSLDSLYLFSSEKFRRVILHEFGHALGLLHEHQHPLLNINWNLPALYQYYKDNYQADSVWVNENVLQKYNSSSGVYCEPDVNSIMIYEIPDFLTNNSLNIVENSNLSPLDKKYIRYIYNKLPCN